MIKGKKIHMTGREKRARRVRRKVTGTLSRPRMSVTRSLNNMYVQLIDDTKGVTIIGVSTSGPEFGGIKDAGPGKTGRAKEIGKLVAAKAKEQGIERVVFDRNGYLFHGRVKAVADGAREGGLIF